MELQFYEAMMGVLERGGAPAGAAAFAAAAVQQVDAALGAHEDGRVRREGRLWANLFEYALQASRFEVRRPREVALPRARPPRVLGGAAWSAPPP